MEVERYSHVMHIGSMISGRLRPGIDALDAPSRNLAGRDGEWGTEDSGDADH